VSVGAVSRLLDKLIIECIDHFSNPTFTPKTPSTPNIPAQD
jgi:hypothetical protein